MHETRIKREMEKYPLLIALNGKKQPRNMSSIMKRKLSVCIALCGEAKIVLLDEPSEGMNRCAHQLVWQLLHREKCGRTMLICTRQADEADLLGDRIAILSNGKIKCCGSPQFLKRLLGAAPGYQLTCEKAYPHSYLQRIEAILSNHFGTVKMTRNIDTEVSYMLADEISEPLTACTEELECNLKDLGLKSFELSTITMEEVLMAVAKETCGQTDEVPHICNEDKKKTYSA